MGINTGLSQHALREVVKILNGVLADQAVLSVKLRNYHWNVTGRNFSELHAFFATLYEEIDGIMDDTAERVRALGGRPLGTMKEFLHACRLKEMPSNYPDAENMLANLLGDYETTIQGLRKDVETCANEHKDAGTADFLTGLMETYEKKAWMLRSYKEGNWEKD